MTLAEYFTPQTSGAEQADSTFLISVQPTHGDTTQQHQLLSHVYLVMLDHGN